jgi:hypothetical protein
VTYLGDTHKGKKHDKKMVDEEAPHIHRVVNCRRILGFKAMIRKIPLLFNPRKSQRARS